MIKQAAKSKPQEVKVMNKTKCPDCDVELDVPVDTEKGEILSCSSCGLELEVNIIRADQSHLQDIGMIDGSHPSILPG